MCSTNSATNHHERESSVSGNDLPSFIVIGAMNCGTTSLHRYLDVHPDIGMSRPKETDYFLQETERDLAWYRDRFPTDAQETGEASPNYTKHPSKPGVPKRMSDVVPDAKLIYLVRDPITRIVSHYLHSLDRGRERRPIDAVLSGDLTNNHYVQCSRYYSQIAQYLKYYDPDQILVVASENLRTRRRDALRRIFRFVGVDPMVETSDFDTEHGASSDKSVETWLGHLVSGTQIATWVRRRVPDGVEDWLRSLLHRRPSRPTLSDSLRGRLCDALAADTEKLRSFTGQSFSEWQV